MDIQNHQEAHGAPKLSGRLPSHHLGAANALNYARYLNRPRRFEDTGNESFEGGHLGNALNYARYLNRPQRFEATGNNAMELQHLGRVGYTAVQPVTYLFYQTVQGGPYSYLSVPNSAWGTPSIGLPSQPPGGVAIAPGYYMVQWYGGVQGDGAIYGSDGSDGFFLPSDPIYTQAMNMAAATGIPVRVGILRQTSLPAAASGAIPATVTSAPLTQSGGSSSSVAPIIQPNPNAVSSVPAVVTPVASTTIAPATVTIVSDAPTQIPVDADASNVNPAIVTTGLQFTTLDYFLIAALAAVLILE